MRGGLGALTAALALLPAACTSSTSAAPSTPPDTTVTRTVVATRTPPVTVKALPQRTAAPLPPGRSTPRRSVEKRCPYIASSHSDSPVSVEDIEGDRIYRTVVLTDHTPVGCRFHFYAPPFEAIADIVPTTYRTATDAHNALVLTARTGTELITEHNFVPGLDGILFRTKFFGPDGARDWAFGFAKGRVLVIVHTQRKDTSRNALYLAQAIAPKL